MIACKAVRRSETPSLKISIWKATLVDKMLDIELSIKKTNHHDHTLSWNTWDWFWECRCL